MPDKKADLYNIDWGSLSPQQKQLMDRALTEAEGIKLYQSAGRFGHGAQWAPNAQALGAKGGLTADQATALSRYRAWKTGAQPGAGLPRAPDTDEEIANRAETFHGADKESRADIDAAGKAVDETRSQDNYFTDITNRKGLATAHEQERTERSTPVGPPMEGMGSETPQYVGEQQPVTIMPTSRIGSNASDEDRLADAQLMTFQQLANTPYSNATVSAQQLPAAIATPQVSDDTNPTDARIRDNLRMLMLYGTPRMEFTGNE